jgi:hypothetical protein
VLSTSDIVVIIVGIGLILMGALIATIYTGVSRLTLQEFENLTGMRLTDYTATVGSFIEPVFSMLGLVLIIAAVVHIIFALWQALKQQQVAASV